MAKSKLVNYFNLINKSTFIGNIKFSIKTKQYPESTDITEKGPFVISNTTQKVDMRARGRQGRIRVSCDSTGTKWRWGSLRLAVQPDGGR